MSVSQNGWTVDSTGTHQDKGAILRDIDVPNGVLAGDVAYIFRWLAGEFDSRVERLVKGTCWGWFNRTVRGSTSISNHASGTAVDFNADQHPLGSSPGDTFSDAQIKTIRSIVASTGGVIRWGGDYTGRKDPMHFEINTTAAKVKAFAAQLREDEDDMDQATFTAMMRVAVKDPQVALALGNAAWNHNELDPLSTAKPQGVRRAGGDMREMEARRQAMEKTLVAKIAEVEAKIDALGSDKS